MNFNCVCFGEVLFDVLPNEKKAGGAPMNVAYHLTTLGQVTALISRIGNDTPGNELAAILKEKLINLDYMQMDKTHPTGIVIATPDIAGDMKYDIKPNTAWDYIGLDPQHDALISDASYLIFGSLITRNSISRSTLFSLLEIPVIRVFDVNLRPPYIDRKTLEFQLNKSDILKLNENELNIISGWYVQFKTLEDKTRFLQNRFQIPEIIVTRGAKGAMITCHDSLYYHDGYPVCVADTIGSGDSFVAGYLSSILNHKSKEEALNFACALGAYVASQTGGCPSYTYETISSFQQSLRIPVL